jgi:hypothetical protein
MNTDQELLQMAAKALDNPKIRWNGAIWCNCERMNPADARGNRYPSEWNPLTDDGDALRLAAKVGLTIEVFHGRTIAKTHFSKGAQFSFVVADEKGKDVLAVTRRAIVRAAAEIGRAMP